MSEAFNNMLERRLADPERARAFAVELAHIQAIDSIVSQLDAARQSAHMSKAELARSAGAEPSAVRRLLSAQSVNPTLSTIAELAAAVGLKLTLVPMTEDERAQITDPMVAAV
jgi:DNA-binding phage protein